MHMHAYIHALASIYASTNTFARIHVLLALWGLALEAMLQAPPAPLLTRVDTDPSAMYDFSLQEKPGKRLKPAARARALAAFAADNVVHNGFYGVFTAASAISYQMMRQNLMPTPPRSMDLTSSVHAGKRQKVEGVGTSGKV